VRTFLLMLGAVLCLGANAADATVEEIVTDRPDQTESPVVLQPGQLQIETGFLYSASEDARSLTLPTTLFRVGVVKRLELRVELGGVENDFFNDETGLGDLGIGGKVRLWDEKGWIPEAALLFGTSVPMGEEGFSSERFDPDFRFSFAHTLTDRVGLGYNLGMTWETREEVTSSRLFTLLTERETIDRDTGAFFNYTLTTGIGLTDRLGMFLEVFGDIAINADASPAHYFDGGFTWAPRPNLQFDLSGGIGLSEAADDYFVSAGVSVRFPN
jgi:hypothetical protein